MRHARLWLRIPPESAEGPGSFASRKGMCIRNTGCLVRLPAGGKGGMSQGSSMDKSGSESSLGLRPPGFGARLEEAEKKS